MDGLKQFFGGFGVAIVGVLLVFIGDTSRDLVLTMPHGVEADIGWAVATMIVAAMIPILIASRKPQQE